MQIAPGISWRTVGNEIEIDFKINPIFTAEDINVEIEDGELKIESERERKDKYSYKGVYSKSEQEREQKYKIHIKYLEQICQCKIDVNSIKIPGMVEFRDNKIHIRFQTNINPTI